MSPDTAILLQGPLGKLREAERVLRTSGIEANVVRPPDSDPSAWGATFWLAVASPDVQNAAETLQKAERAAMSPEEQAAADSIIDLDADENSCPACMGTIPKGAKRCPGCGLRLG